MKNIVHTALFVFTVALLIAAFESYGYIVRWIIPLQHWRPSVATPVEFFGVLWISAVMILGWLCVISPILNWINRK